MKKVGIKKFNREMYKYIKDLPLLVVNATKKIPLFLVLPPEEKIIEALEGGDFKDGISSKNTDKPN